MKKIFLSLLVASSLFSCSKDEVNETKSVESVKINSQRVSEDVFGKVYYNKEGNLKLRIMNRFGDTSKISITSAADSKEYFLFDDAEVMHIPVGGKSDVYFLSKARKFVFSNPEENQLLNELKKILIFGTGNHGTSVRLDIAKDLSSIVLSADTSITFTKL